MYLNKMIMNRLFHTCKQLIGVAALSVGLYACDWIHDDSLPLCEFRLYFKYDYNMKFADAFQHEVDFVTLFFCDQEGNFLFQRRIEKSELDIGKYRALLRTVEMGNITRAAEELGYTQSAVSRIIADLEQEWGVTLLTRGRMGVVLSSAGEALLPHLRAVCNADRELLEEVDQLHGLTRGTIRVGTFNSISVHWLPRLMKTFLERYPGIRFEVMTHIEYREIEEWVAGGHVDCGFIALPSALTLDTVFLRRDRHMAVLPLDHPLAGEESYPISRFAEDSFIKLEDDRDREIVQIFERYQVKPNLQYRVNDDYAAIAMVENGLGVSVLTELVLQRTPYGVAVKPLDPPQFRDIGLAVRSRRSASPATARFLDHVERWATEGI